MLDFRAFQVQPQMEPQYLGSSSAFAFSRIISLSLNRNLPPTPTGELGDRQGSTPSPSPCPLPDYDIALSLSNAYFKNIHPQYPFLHEPTFRTWETKIYDASPDVVDSELYGTLLFFTNMVFTPGSAEHGSSECFARLADSIACRSMPLQHS